MKKISTHIYIVLGLFLALFIVGSFLDLQISEAIFSRDNTFGLIISVLGTIPGYGLLAIIGGAMFSLVIYKKEKYKIFVQIIFWILTIACLGLSIYFSGREFFGPNGFVGTAPRWVGYLIILPVAAALFYLGFRMGKNSENDRLWLLLVIMMIAIFLALIPGVTMLKAIFHRPRYRLITWSEVQGTGLLDFQPWWERCKDYNDLIKTFKTHKPNPITLNGAEITSEEFKSFPSGHGGASAIFMLGALVLPLVNKKYEKYQIPVFYCGLAWCLLVCFVRILVGAHFLSDVSMGSLLSIIFILVAYFVIYKTKWFASYLNEETALEEN